MHLGQCHINHRVIKFMVFSISLPCRYAIESVRRLDDLAFTLIDWTSSFGNLATQIYFLVYFCLKSGSIISGYSLKRHPNIGYAWLTSPFNALHESMKVRHLMKNSRMNSVQAASLSNSMTSEVIHGLCFLEVDSVLVSG